MDKGPSEITPLRIYKKNPVSGHSQIYYFIPVIQNKSMKSQTVFINAAEKYLMINSVTILVSLVYYQKITTRKQNQNDHLYPG